MEANLSSPGPVFTGPILLASGVTGAIARERFAANGTVWCARKTRSHASGVTERSQPTPPIPANSKKIPTKRPFIQMSSRGTKTAYLGPDAAASPGGAFRKQRLQPQIERSPS